MTEKCCKELKDKIKTTVVKHPVLATGVGVCVGISIGVLLGHIIKNKR